MAAYSVPQGAVVLLRAAYVEDGKVKPGVAMDPQPATISADADGVFPFVRINGEERQFRPPPPERTPDQRRAFEIDAELVRLDAKMSRRDEDMWLAFKSLNATVPLYVADIIARKQALRDERRGLTL